MALSPGDGSSGVVAGDASGDQEIPFRISVVGAGNPRVEEMEQAEELGRFLGKAGAVVVTGGLGGVMEAVSRGCALEGGFTVGFLPGEDPGSANPWVRLPLATGLGEARNVLVVRAGEAVVAVGGEWGTLSEIALARKMGREVAVLGESSWELPLPRMDSPGAAAAWALRRAGEGRRGKSLSHPGDRLP
jgi:uncharacterized protein (TIGR00725 family)